MALVKLGATITGISGSIGGVTFTRCKAGTVAKSWARPSNPMTEWQQNTRASTSNWPQMWRDLSAGQRQDWADLAAAPPETDYDPFGAVVLISGYNWFVRINGRRLYTGQAPAEDAPAAFTPSAPTITAITVSVPADIAGDSWIEFSDTEFAADEWCVWFNSFASSIGNQTKQTDWKLVGIGLAEGVTSLDASFIFAIRYGYFPPAWLATARVFRQTADSFRSVPTVIKAVVQS